MRITNLIDEAEDIESQLQRVASSDDHLEAFRGQRLLELVSFLQGRGSVPVAFGSLHSPELWLWPSNPANKVWARIWVDWRDYGPAESGLPKSPHYRLEIRRGNAALSQDARADTPEEVERIISQAFGWMR